MSHDIQPSFFVGFGELEQLLQTHEPGNALYLNIIYETHSSRLGIQCQYTFIMVTDIQEQRCRFWRKPLGFVEYLGDKCMEPEKRDRIQKRSDSIIKVLTGLIAERFNIQVQGAIVAMPKDFVLFNGDTELLNYDQTSGEYSAAPLKEAA